MFTRIRQRRRFAKVTALSKRYKLTLVTTDQAVVVLSYNKSIQLAVSLSSSTAKLYIHAAQAIPYVIATLVLALSKLFPCQIAGVYYSGSATSEPQLRLVKTDKELPNA